MSLMSEQGLAGLVKFEKSGAMAPAVDGKMYSQG